MNRFAHTGRGDFSGFKKRSNGMFSAGEYIVYGTTGVCKVEAVGPMQMSGMSSKEKLYYTLSPLYSKGSKVFIPVDNDKVVIRSVLTKEEASALVEEIPSIELLWVADEKRREDIYKTALRTCDPKEWIKIIKTLYLRKMSRIAEGKKVTVSDGKYLHMAEERLYEELALALEMPKEEVIEYITSHVEKSEEVAAQ